MIEQTLRLLLDGVGRSDEYEFYLNRFRTYDAPCFSFLVPDLEAAVQARSSILASLDFLRKLELYPGILFAGLSSSDPRTISFGSSIQEDLLLSIEMEGPGLIESRIRREAELARREKKIPVFYLRMPLEKAVHACARVTNRFQFLRVQGPIQTVSGPAPYIDPHQAHEFASIQESSFSRFASGVLLQDPSLHISLCSPYRLLQEIFTVKGAGTIFRPRSMVHSYTKLESVDQERLIALLESSFGRRLRDLSSLHRASHFYIEENYRGAVLLEPAEPGWYLSKFAVSTLARGEGIAQDLWTAVLDTHSSVFWRAKRGNPIERWYSRIADGFQRKGMWNVYWKNLSLDRIADVIRYCENRPEDFDPS